MFDLIRILGNDLEGRHAKGQTIRNLKFILDNEYPFENTTKVFIINRILDESVVDQIYTLLGDEYPIYNIPFVAEEYVQASDKINYLTNVNAARNLLLVPDEEVFLPLDGNCFFRLDGWLRFVNGLEYGRGYAAIQMVRSTAYPDPKSSEMFSWYEKWKFGKKEVFAPTEPQIAFLPDYDIEYDESINYGAASKLSLLYRIGYRGVWDNWFPELRARGMLYPSKYFGKACEGGWCFRLPSGVDDAEINNTVRSRLRDIGIQRLIEHANSKI
jgi:hypothetical protein